MGRVRHATVDKWAQFVLGTKVMLVLMADLPSQVALPGQCDGDVLPTFNPTRRLPTHLSLSTCDTVSRRFSPSFPAHSSDYKWIIVLPTPAMLMSSHCQWTFLAVEANYSTFGL